jgi:hypothetical protein
MPFYFRNGFFTKIWAEGYLLLIIFDLNHYPITFSILIFSLPVLQCFNKPRQQLRFHVSPLNYQGACCIHTPHYASTPSLFAINFSSQEHAAHQCGKQAVLVLSSFALVNTPLWFGSEFHLA